MLNLLRVGAKIISTVQASKTNGAEAAPRRAGCSPATAAATCSTPRCTPSASASQPTATWPGDGLELYGTRITAPVRCAPPENKPTPTERDTCRPWLARELALLRGTVRAVVVLGGFGWQALLPVLATPDPAGGHRGWVGPRPRPAFGHGAHVTLAPADPARAAPLEVFGSYHVSQQNTFTGNASPRRCSRSSSPAPRTPPASNRHLRPMPTARARHRFRARRRSPRCRCTSTHHATKEREVSNRPTATPSPRSPIGRGRRLKIAAVWVRAPPGAPVNISPHLPGDPPPRSRHRACTFREPVAGLRGSPPTVLPPRGTVRRRTARTALTGRRFSETTVGR